jgi:SARP family transcriptional regulator, regulator of embCAB operon
MTTLLSDQSSNPVSATQGDRSAPDHSQLTSDVDQFGGFRFDLLGPLSIKFHGRDVTPSPPKQKRLLSVLLLNANKQVNTSTLLSELWEHNTPRSAGATLQTYVFKLRKHFESVLGCSADHIANEVLLTCQNGYQLNVDPAQLDITEFDELVAAGTETMRDGDYERAAHHLDRALSLWRGDIIPDRCGQLMLAEVTRLNELQLYARITRNEASLCLGKHREIIGELASLAVAHPLHEGVHIMLAIAMFRSSRISAALDVLSRYGARMRAELGLEPSSRMRSLHVAVLSADQILSDDSITTEALLDSLCRAGSTRRPSSLAG